MKPAPDWRDALASLAGTLPDDGPSTPAPEPEPAPAAIGRLHIAYERKGRGGKEATIIYGFECDDATLASLASRMKRDLATGGSCRDGEILLQGDRREAARQWLSRNLGVKAK